MRQEHEPVVTLADELGERIAAWGSDASVSQEMPADLAADLEEWRGTDARTIHFAAKLC